MNSWGWESKIYQTIEDENCGKTILPMRKQNRILLKYKKVKYKEHIKINNNKMLLKCKK